MGDSNEQKANQLVEEASAKLKGASSGFFGFLFGGASKEDEGLEMLGRAANLYKMAKNWGKAGNTFTKIATHHAKKGVKHDAATNFVEAANCYKKTDPKEASESLLKAIDIYTDMGRFTIAAKHHQTVAELFEDNVANLDTVIQHYQIAADYFRGEESTSSANKCLVKVAEYSATLEKYDKAIQIYEQIATDCIQSNLLKYAAKDYFFKALLCHLCVDSLNASHALTRYEDQYPAFTDAREAKLIKSLSQEIDNQDVEAFTEAVKQYDSISRLDSWHTTLLLRVKKNLNSEDDLC